MRSRKQNRIASHVGSRRKPGHPDSRSFVPQSCDKMAEAHPHDISKHLTWKPDAKAQIRSRHRLKTYLTQAHTTSAPVPLEPEAPLVDLTKPANGNLPLDVQTICSKVQARLMQYPDTALSVQYNGALLRILEHCRELESSKAKLEQHSSIEKMRGDELVAADEDELKALTQLHCSSCNRARKESVSKFLESHGPQGNSLANQTHM